MRPLGLFCIHHTAPGSLCHDRTASYTPVLCLNIETCALNLVVNFIHRFLVLHSVFFLNGQFLLWTAQMFYWISLCQPPSERRNPQKQSQVSSAVFEKWDQACSASRKRHPSQPRKLCITHNFYEHVFNPCYMWFSVWTINVSRFIAAYINTVIQFLRIAPSKLKGYTNNPE